MPEPEVRRHRTSSAVTHEGAAAPLSHLGASTLTHRTGLGGHVGGQRMLSGQMHPGVC